MIIMKLPHKYSKYVYLCWQRRGSVTGHMAAGLWMGCPGGQVKAWQAEKKTLHGASGWKLGLTKRLTQESSQAVSSAAPRTDTLHRLDTPGFPLRWHPSPKTFRLASEQKKEVNWQWLRNVKSALPALHCHKKTYSSDTHWSNLHLRFSCE